MLEANQKKSFKRILRLLLENAARFIINVGFVYVFSALFGQENTLLGVAIGVGFTMFPTLPVGIRPSTMAVTIVGLTMVSSVSAQFALLPWWMALPVNFLTVALILLVIGEPLVLKPYITFLLTFVFAQATPVPWELFPRRMAASLAGSLFVSVVTLFVWHRTGLGYRDTVRSFREQVHICQKNRGYILRASIGIAAAMLIGMALHLKKPLWISIVVMSLTQPEFKDTFERIKARFVGTLIGIALFVIIFVILVPKQYAMTVILFIGYLSFFTPEYKNKQIVNAINAINASLVLLDTTSAIQNRFFSLLGGIGIVVALCGTQSLVKKLERRAYKLT